MTSPPGKVKPAGRRPWALRPLRPAASGLFREFLCDFGFFHQQVGVENRLYMVKCSHHRDIETAATIPSSSQEMAGMALRPPGRAGRDEAGNGGQMNCGSCETNPIRPSRQAGRVPGEGKCAKQSQCGPVAERPAPRRANHAKQTQFPPGPGATGLAAGTGPIVRNKANVRPAGRLGTPGYVKRGTKPMAGEARWDGAAGGWDAGQSCETKPIPRERHGTQVL
jgi:hypothetical protein